MKRFRSVKYFSWTTFSPAGNPYEFTKDKDTVAEYRGTFYPDDEAWMVFLTTHKGGNILEWVNQPESLLKVTEEVTTKNVTNIEDMGDFKQPEILPDLSVGKTIEQIEAEVRIATKAKLQEDIEAGLVEEVLVTPEVMTVEEALQEEPEVNGLEFFKDELSVAKSIPKFIKAMKIEFDVDELEEMCSELGIEYEKPKATAIQNIIDKLGE